MKRLAFFVALTLLPTGPVAAAPDALEVGNFARVYQADGHPIVGEVLETSDTELKVLAVKTLKTETFKTDRLPKPPRALSNDETVEAVGLSAFFAWQIHHDLKTAGAGKIADITPAAIYTTIGKKAGVERGQRLFVFRNQGEVRDPDTGKVLSTKRSKIATLEVTDVEEQSCKAKRKDDFESEIKVGDLVEVDAPAKRIAVLPLTALDQNEATSLTGRRFAEDLTTKLVNFQVAVVERSQLDKVMKELLLQQTKLVDPSTASKIGKQVGAFAILTGSIIPKGKRLEANVRLIRVETGEILAAESAPIDKLIVAVERNKPADTPPLPEQPVANVGAASSVGSPKETKQFQGPWLKNVTLKPPYRPSYVGAPTDKMSLEYAVMELLSQAGLKYDFNGSLRNASIECRTWVYPKVENRPCGAAVQELLGPLGMTYDVNGGTVTLRRK